MAKIPRHGNSATAVLILALSAGLFVSSVNAVALDAKGPSQPESKATTANTVNAQSKDPPIDRFEDAIKAFEAADKIHPPPADCTDFVGSSTFEHWKTLEQDFSQFKAINRGFGGSTIRECTHYAGRIVTNYRPHRIVFYAGTNDIADDVPGDDVFKRFKAFVERVRQDLPTTEIDFISISITPSRVRWAKQYEIANSEILAFIKTNQHLRYIDVTQAMRDSNGKLRGDLFGSDQLHMNAKGYAIWHRIIEEALRKFQAEESHA